MKKKFPLALNILIAVLLTVVAIIATFFLTALIGRLCNYLTPWRVVNDRCNCEDSPHKVLARGVPHLMEYDHIDEEELNFELTEKRLNRIKEKMNRKVYHLNAEIISVGKYFYCVDKYGNYYLAMTFQYVNPLNASSWGDDVLFYRLKRAGKE